MNNDIRQPIDIICKYYSPDSDLYHTLTTHSEQVKNKALDIARNHPELNVDIHFLEEAALLHDIGIFMCHAPGIFCYGSHRYIEHGYLGADLLRSEGWVRHALVCERHTGAGLSLQSIISQNLPLPHRDMTPQSIEEQIICYADKFYSKSNLQNTNNIEKIRKDMARFGEENLERFDRWHQQFK